MTHRLMTFCDCGNISFAGVLESEILGWKLALPPDWAGLFWCKTCQRTAMKPVIAHSVIVAG